MSRSLGWVAAGGLASIAGIILFSSLGLPARIEQTLVALSLLPALAAVVVGHRRTFRRLSRQPAAVAYRARYSLPQRLIPSAVFAAGLVAAKVLQVVEAPSVTRLLAGLLGLVGAVVVLMIMRRRM